MHPDLLTKVNIFDPFDYDPNNIFVGSTNTSDIDVHGTGVACLIGGITDGGGDLASIGFKTDLLLYNVDLEYYWYIIAQKAHHASFVENAKVINLSIDGSLNHNIAKKIRIDREITLFISRSNSCSGC
jgi:hypothetical protein